MANPHRELPQNVPGLFFVDDTCIDCDTCREIAPRIFRDHGGQSSVYSQPLTTDERSQALKALVCCPTASIGTRCKTRDVNSAVAAYPEQIEDNVYFCGFTSEKSFGGWSYLIVRSAQEGGNILVDSPRFTRPLVRPIREMGGITTMFLTHRDDIADHALFAREFQCTRIMHNADGASRLGIERTVDRDEAFPLERDLIAIPTPGHTRGHMVLLYGQKYLFTGDHLAWSPESQSLKAYRDVCWYSWADQIRSMERLLEYGFEWVLPGHGRMHRATAEEMHLYLEDCIRSMKLRPGSRHA